MEDDLYGDLDYHSKNAEIESLNKQLSESEQNLSESRKEIEQLRSKICVLVEEKRTVENNIVSVYNTALREIKRKDRELAELRKTLSERPPQR